MDETRQAGAPAPEKQARAHAWRKIRRAAITAGALVLAFIAYTEIRDYRLDRQLLAETPDRIPSDPALLAYANSAGKAAFQANCVSCHGADMKGSQTQGVPNLTDDIWLYDFGRVSDIERTVLYGIRSGAGKSHNVTDMPAIGLQKALNPDEIKDVVAYTLSLSHHKQDAAAVERGSKLFQDKGVCYDCHSRDATVIPDYGAPNLIDDDWLYGSDEKAIYKSVYDGRHGVCPAWIGRLSFPAIRAIAAFIHSMSKESPESPNSRTAAGEKAQSHG
jgi:cytochrome c oxidase cbb3-type subunit 3